MDTRLITFSKSVIESEQNWVIIDNGVVKDPDNNYETDASDNSKYSGQTNNINVDAFVNAYLDITDLPPMLYIQIKAPTASSWTNVWYMRDGGRVKSAGYYVSFFFPKQYSLRFHTSPYPNPASTAPSTFKLNYCFLMHRLLTI